jgi:pyruvate dehydrogenase E2 component (dihydrolipoamide acetyltransferase)
MLNPMSDQVFIPKLGQTVEEVTVGQWLVADGSPVRKGQEILNIETDKAVFAVEAPSEGFVHFGPVKEGDVLPVLSVVASIGAADEAFAGAPVAGKGETPAATAPAVAIQSEPARASAAPPAAGAVFASPRARSLAERKGVDLGRVAASGPLVPGTEAGARILERDVLDYLDRRPRLTPVARDVEMAARPAARPAAHPAARPPARPPSPVAPPPIALATPAPVAPTIAPPAAPALPVAPALPADVLARIPLKGIRGLIAERMAASVHTTARVTLVMEVDASEFVAMRERLKARLSESWGFAPGYNDFLGKIVAAALRQFPSMNARLNADAIEQMAAVNLGMAVDTERGLLVPVIRNADQKSLRQFGQEFRALAERARQGKVLPDDLSGGTFTITSLGSFDIDAFTPVINLPEAAILGVGRIAPKAVVREGQIVARQMWTLSLVFDHRLVDGAPAARFLQAIKAMIEEPYLLLAG